MLVQKAGTISVGWKHYIDFLGWKINLSGISPAKPSRSGPNSVYVYMSRGGNVQGILDKMEAGTSPAEREFFCVVIHATFRQLRNGRFSASQIWTKDVWKRPILRTDVLSHQISSPVPPESSPKPHFGWPFNAKPIIQIALRKSRVNGATKVKLYSYSVHRYRQVPYLECVKIFTLGTSGGRSAP